MRGGSKTVKPWAIGCCGCHRPMGSDGKPLGERQTGSFNIQHLIDNSRHGKVAMFATKEKADARGEAFGWMCTDGNHRCPECKAEWQRMESATNRGCYLNVADLES